MSSILFLFSLLFLIFCSQSFYTPPQGASSSSIWDHNGSINPPTSHMGSPMGPIPLPPSSSAASASDWSNSNSSLFPMWNSPDNSGGSLLDNSGGSLLDNSGGSLLDNSGGLGLTTQANRVRHFCSMLDEY